MDIGIETLLPSERHKVAHLLSDLELWAELDNLNDEHAKLEMTYIAIENLTEILEVTSTETLTPTAITLLSATLSSLDPSFVITDDLEVTTEAADGVVKRALAATGEFIRKIIDKIKRLAEWVFSFLQNQTKRATKLKAALPTLPLRVSEKMLDVKILGYPAGFFAQIQKNLINMSSTAAWSELVTFAKNGVEVKVARGDEPGSNVDVLPSMGKHARKTNKEYARRTGKSEIKLPLVEEYIERMIAFKANMTSSYTTKKLADFKFTTINITSVVESIVIGLAKMEAILADERKHTLSIIGQLKAGAAVYAKQDSIDPNELALKYVTVRAGRLSSITNATLTTHYMRSVNQGLKLVALATKYSDTKTETKQLTT